MDNPPKIGVNHNISNFQYLPIVSMCSYGCRILVRIRTFDFQTSESYLVANFFVVSIISSNRNFCLKKFV